MSTTTPSTPPSCCPPGALGPAPLCDRSKPKGEMIEWTTQPLSSSDEASSSIPNSDKLRVYKVGGNNDDNGTTNSPPKQQQQQQKYRIIVVFTDVYGLDSGNHQVFCDTIHDHLNKTMPTIVYCPDLFRGTPLMTQRGWSDALNITLGGGIVSIISGLRGRCSATNIDRDLLQIIESNILRGGESVLLPVGVVGFCFGGWVVGRALSLTNTRNVFGAGVGIHPSFQLEGLANGGTTEQQLAERMGNKPILFLPAKQDDGLKPTSKVVQYMARRRATTPEQLSIPFESMPHGFVARGDFLGPTYKEAQEKAIQLTVKFLEEHIKV